nr:phosphotransferase family protein [Rhodococcus sp. HNM0569]
MQEALERRLSALSGDACTVSGLARLTGGASRETWSFTADDRALVLRRDPPGSEDPARIALEGAAFGAAGAAGVPVPQVVEVASPGTADDIGSAYLLMHKVNGEALPQRLLRDDHYARVRTTLPYELGRVAARIHRMDPSALPGLAGGDQVQELFDEYTRTGPPLPVLEIAFAWLRAHRPSESRDTVVHGDFRNGNVLVDEDGITAVLDWELVHRGDPMEDLGWLCVKTWRFGSPHPVGGFGSRDELFRGYHDESGTAPDAEAVHWWEVYGTLRWAVMCRMQTQRGRAPDATNPLELLAIGRRIAECEHDLLALLGHDADGEDPPLDLPEESSGDLFGQPALSELVDAVRAFLRDRDEPDPRGRYLARVASGVLDVVRREATVGPVLRGQHENLVTQAGFDSEADLALGLRAGSCSADDPRVARAIRHAVAARLAVAHPGY